MIHRISVMCAERIIALGNLQETDESVLQYGCELIITSVFGLLLLMGMSLLISYPMAWLFFVLGFAVHRTYAGGYHANTHIGCYIVTSIMFLVGTITATAIEWHHFTYLVIAVLSAMLVVSMAPLAASNKPLSKNRFRRNRKRILIIVCINLIISIFFAAMKLVSKEGNIYFAGIFFASLSLIMGKIKNKLKGGS